MNGSPLPPEHDWPQLPPGRKDALRIGAAWYFTGKPCRHGHTAPKRTGNSTCGLCARRHSAGYYDKAVRPGVIERKRKWEAERPAREAAQRERNRQWQRERYRQQLREEGTEPVRASHAERTRQRYRLNPDKDRERARDKYRRGVKSGPVTHKRRTPPWLTGPELAAIDAIYASPACCRSYRTDRRLRL